MGAFALLVLTLAASPAAFAHPPGATGPGWGELLRQWSVEPWVIVLLAASGGLYARGIARLWREAGPRRGIAARQAAAFAGGWLALVLALVSPLDGLGARLFSAHMVQHEVLMLVAAPLLVIGRPLAAWAWGLPKAALGGFMRVFRSRGWASSWSLLTDPLAAWSLHALALWAWHVPAFFEAAVEHTGWHVAQHVSFLGTALLFWWAVLGGDARVRQGTGAAMLYLFTTMMHTSALGALLTLAPTPWYPAYAATSGALGLDPVEDQQLGGLVMWVPGAFAYLFAALALMARLLASPGVSPATSARPVPPRSTGA